MSWLQKNLFSQKSSYISDMDENNTSDQKSMHKSKDRCTANIPKLRIKFLIFDSKRVCVIERRLRAENNTDDADKRQHKQLLEDQDTHAP